MRFLYLISHPQGWRKVGRAEDPLRRLKQHQAHSGRPLVGEAIFPTDDAVKAEREALRALGAYRIMGEWFEVNREAAIQVLETVVGAKAEPFPTAASKARRSYNQPCPTPFIAIWQRLRATYPEMTASGVNLYLADNIDVWIDEVRLKANPTIDPSPEWVDHMRQKFRRNADIARQNEACTP